MTDEDDRFDVDRALGRLSRRVAWLRWGAIGGLAALAGLAWWAGVHVAVVASDPLHPVVSAIDIPLPVLNPNGSMDRSLSVAERALAVVGTVMCLVVAVAYKATDGLKRHLVLGCGGAMLGLVAFTQWATSGDELVNRDIERLARAGAYTELVSRTKSRPQMPYANYIGAQALLLAGDRARLRAEYGEWLLRWSQEGARAGYLGAHRAAPGVPEWEGSHASPQVMRALEIAAFGNEVTPFSRPYLREALAKLAHAKHALHWQVPVLGIGSLAWLAAVVTWRRARRNLRLAEQCVVNFDYYQAAPPPPGGPAALAASAPSTLPPIDFQPEQHAVR